jgi:proline dehydrogenase
MALTDEDKQWIEKRLERVVEQVVERVIEQVVERVVEQVVERVIEQVVERVVEQVIEKVVEQVVEQVVAKSRDMQTEVLTYVANLAEPINTRIRHVEANAGNLETAERKRLAAIEDRLLRIEKKLGGGLL